MSEITNVTNDYATLFKTLVSGLIAHPENLQVEIHPSQSTIIFVKAHATDKPRILGRLGQTIEHIHDVLREIAKRRGDEIKIMVSNEVVGEFEKSQPFTHDPLWNRDQMVSDAIKIIAQEIDPNSRIMVTSGGDTSMFTIVGKLLSLQPALNRIFKAWGMNMRRRIFVEVNEK